MADAQNKDLLYGIEASFELKRALVVLCEGATADDLSTLQCLVAAVAIVEDELRILYLKRGGVAPTPVAAREEVDNVG